MGRYDFDWNSYWGYKRAVARHYERGYRIREGRRNAMYNHVGRHVHVDGFDEDRRTRRACGYAIRKDGADFAVFIPGHPARP